MAATDVLTIFDCDGVLVDSEVVVVQQEEAALRSLGIDIDVDGIVERYVGLSYASMEAKVIEEFDVDVPPGFFDQIQADALASFPELLQPVPGMVDVVASLTGPKCVASSSDLDRIHLSLDLTGHAPSFAAGTIFSAQMVEHGKPAPDLFLHAASTMGHDPTRCVVIEDSPHGVTAAVAAGMHPIGLVAGGHCPPGLGDRLREAGARSIAASAEELRAQLTQAGSA